MTSARDLALLQRFFSARRLRPSTRKTYSQALACFGRLVGVPLEEAGRPEWREWYLRASGLGLAAGTMLMYASRLATLLVFALRARGLRKGLAQDRVEDLLEPVPLVDLRREELSAQRLRDMLVMPEEVEGMVAAARHPRVRALIAVLAESGCRKGEVLGLRIRDITRYTEYWEIRVVGKTGERTLPLVRSVPYLRAWLEKHPDPRPGAPLWAVMYRGQVRRMGESGPNVALQRLSDRSGSVHVFPHMLRHTRLTSLAEEGVGEYLLKSFAGWTPDSRMAARYIHLSGRSHVPVILRLEKEVRRRAEKMEPG